LLLKFIWEWKCSKSVHLEINAYRYDNIKYRDDLHEEYRHYEQYTDWGEILIISNSDTKNITLDRFERDLNSDKKEFFIPKQFPKELKPGETIILNFCDLDLIQLQSNYEILVCNYNKKKRIQFRKVEELEMHYLQCGIEFVEK